MFSDFKTAFIKKPQFVSNVPQAVIDVISQELPEGFYYVQLPDGFCRLEVPAGFNLNSGRILPSKQMKEALPEGYTSEDIKKYSYNSQADIVVVPDEDGCFNINGKRIKAEKMVRAPLQEYRFTNIRLILKPKPFPDPVELQIGGDGYVENLLVERTPNNSIDIISFRSIDDSVLSVYYSVNTKGEDVRFNFTLNVELKKAKSVKEIVGAVHIYNAFLEGKGEVGGERLVLDGIVESSKISDDTILFWDKLNKLEELLKLNFDITNGIEDEDEVTIERLYQCLIKRKPYRIHRSYKSLKGRGDFKEAIDLEETKKLYMEFSATEETKLLGNTIQLYGVHGIFGAQLNKENIIIDAETGELEINFESNQNSSTFESVMLFLSQDQERQFTDKADYIKILEKAEEIVGL